jgi:hypothetical protein
MVTKISTQHKMTDEATHQPILFELIRQTKGAILELGAGYSSTEQIHAMSPGRKILTVDDHQEWLDNFKHLETDNHKFALLTDNLFALHWILWDVVLVDLSTWDQRLWAIEQLRFYAGYMIIHDAQDKDLKRYFKYAREYRVDDFPMPTTLLGSNKYDLKSINIEGAILI